MIDSAITTEHKFREDLYSHFHEHSLNALATVLRELNNCDFYMHVKNKLLAGANLTIDLPELENVSKEKALEIVDDLIVESRKLAATAWELATAQAECFGTTVRFEMRQGELIPNFDIEYKGIDDYATAKIKVTTWRRSLKVELVGDDGALEKMSQQLLLATMRGRVLDFV